MFDIPSALGKLSITATFAHDPGLTATPAEARTARELALWVIDTAFPRSHRVRPQTQMKVEAASTLLNLRATASKRDDTAKLTT